MGKRGGTGAQQRAQSEILGLALVITMSIALVTFMVVTASGGIVSVQRTVDTNKAETALGVLDMRASAVSFGESDLQTVSFGNTGGGSLYVDDTEGSITIIHTDLDGDETVLYSGTLGALIYENDGTEIAYQGGGVWRLDADGQARVVSAPEFHYRDATLTLPVVRVTGDGSVSGQNAQIQATHGSSKRIFPNVAKLPESGDLWENPGSEGTVKIVVQSRYYEGWAQYFEMRTTGKVTPNEEAQTVTLDLTVPYDMGFFNMPAEGQPLKLRALEEENPLESFSITLYPDQTAFSNFKWSFTATSENGEEMEIHLRDGGPVNVIENPLSQCKERWVSVTIIYKDGSTYQGWFKDKAFASTCLDLDGDGTADTARLDVDLGTLAMDMSYESKSTLKSVDNLLGGSVNQLDSTLAFNNGQNAPMGAVLSHYLAKMGPDVDLIVSDKNADTVDEMPSHGVIHYDQRNYTLYYLHISDNEVVIDVQ
ncbi:hypothetical protein [Haladaptatus sp. DYSN1]|uniref:DUF7289 family protein n=1 Tax=unclassified Haladaptatus TaxID=2622732 RepID=UPI0024068D00|nr:hypothetical protein [Haladaptatus sp. DYSN1]